MTGKITYDGVKFSLFCRGKRIGEMTKMQLVDTLFQDIMLEKKLLGEFFSVDFELFGLNVVICADR
jgi:hypothetical protein